MNIYDTANKLASEIKLTEEYKAYKNSKEQIESNVEIKSKIEEFDKLRVMVTDINKIISEAIKDVIE